MRVCIEYTRLDHVSVCLCVQVESLQSKVTELESGSMNRHQFEVTEHKVRTYAHFISSFFLFFANMCCSVPPLPLSGEGTRAEVGARAIQCSSS